MKLCAAIALGLVAASVPTDDAAAQTARRTPTRIPDGQYRCQMWIGSSYVNLAATLAGGSASANALTKAGATITAVTPASGGITIAYTTARGYRESMDCKRA